MKTVFRTLTFSNRGLVTRLLAIGLSCATLSPLIAEAGAITISNNIENTVQFDTDVTGSVSHLPPFFQIHSLVDIPNTPWVSTSRITESAGLTADTISVIWTIQHILGPDATDVNPNPNEPVTLSLAYTATAPGFFVAPGPVAGRSGVRLVVEHPLTAAGPHFDVLDLNITGTVTANFFGYLSITSYKIQYLAQHAPAIDPISGTPIYGDPPPPDGDGGFAEVPEPSGFVLACLAIVTFAPVTMMRNRFRQLPVPVRL